MSAIWFVLGVSLGASAMGWFMNSRFLKALVEVERGIDGLIAEHDHVVRGLIARLNDNDPRKVGRNDPLS